MKHIEDLVRKNLKSKIDNIFSRQVKDLFGGAEIHCGDFEQFFADISPSENDFMFLDPPYDTEFSDYEGSDFSKDDQMRLANLLKSTKAKFVLVIKDTDFIRSLYQDGFNVFSFDKSYTYNVRDRNDRSVRHLVITNFSA